MTSAWGAVFGAAFGASWGASSEATPALPGGGGSGKRYKPHAPPAWWGDEKKKKRVEALELQVAKAEKRIELKQLKLRKLVSLDAIDRALAEIEVLSKRLFALMADLEEAKQAHEDALDEEAALVYAIYRTLH